MGGEREQVNEGCFSFTRLADAFCATLSYLLYGTERGSFLIQPLNARRGISRGDAVYAGPSPIHKLQSVRGFNDELRALAIVWIGGNYQGSGT